MHERLAISWIYFSLGEHRPPAARVCVHPVPAVGCWCGCCDPRPYGGLKPALRNRRRRVGLDPPFSERHLIDRGVLIFSALVIGWASPNEPKTRVRVDFPKTRVRVGF